MLRRAQTVWGRRLFSSLSRENSKAKEATSVEKDVPQAPNRRSTWSLQQMPKSLVFKDARFEVADLSKQPNPAASIELIAQVPVKEVETNVVACEGGGNLATGHPKIYINLDQNKPISCTYCGLRYLHKAH